MDLHDQLKKLFPNHEVSIEPETIEENQYYANKSLHAKPLFIQKEPIICQFEKRKGKPTTIICGYHGDEADFKILAKEIKSKLAVGGSFKDGEIIIQGNYRDKIMTFLQEKGFKTKRVGG